MLCDLLTPGNQGLKIRQHIKSGIYVENLTEVQVTSHNEIERLINEGGKARATAATKMNERSSRSHAVRSHCHRLSSPRLALLTELCAPPPGSPHPSSVWTALPPPARTNPAGVHRDSPQDFRRR